MHRYLIRRCLLLLPFMVAVSFLVFAMMHLIPADPAEVALRSNAITPTPEAIALTRHELGLDAPFWSRYGQWLWQVLHLDFGRSFITRAPVLAVFVQALPATLELAGAAFVLIVLLSLPLGIGCALRENRLFDKAVRCVLFITVAMPAYWLGLLLIWGLAVGLAGFEVAGRESHSAVVLPAITLACGYLGTYVRLIRGNMLAALNQPFVWYARARGLPERVIILRHVLMNSLHSALSAMAMSLPKLMAGTVVIESVFAWPGIGRLCVSAIFNRDYPVIQMYILFMAMLFLVSHLLVDIAHAWLDPRIAKGSGR
ncbi:MULTISPECIES: nickel/cobalt ABC transporter permease [Dickeya]|uniref:Nickel transport system permease protein NikB (TC 3.A.1.5.3) n=1 Tax=Dickeya aquatica TaxID=1401087 RepID=A0A375AAB8_9GAMM|nr:MULTISPECIES: nickel/cobalt ABC transporter permease [Dickeya]SLM62549.1 Nickel transport system permease protein NikB (TC 3.A.1.5.3) [Dickeya aquatica]